MASLSLMHPKYKDELEKDVDLDFIYVLLGLAGITQVFMNFYPQRRGQFNFHRDGFQKKSDNSKPVADAKKVKTKQFVHKADLGPISFQACSLQRQRALEVNHHQVLWHGPSGQVGRGITSVVQHMAEPGPGVKRWDTGLVIDCTPAQRAHISKS